MERGTLAPRQRVPFFVHVDEFQTFSSDAFASLLSEARKFATYFCLANQYTDQLPLAALPRDNQAGAHTTIRMRGDDALLRERAV